MKGVDDYKEAFEGTCKNISDAVVKKMKEVEEQTTSTLNSKVADTWIAGDQFYSCLPCMMFKKDPNVPASFRRDNKGNFGIVCLDQAENDFKKTLRRHENTELHNWCVMKAEKDKQEALSAREQNIKIGEKIVSNAIFCI